MCSMTHRQLEFGQIGVDLGHLSFSYDDLNSVEYIIFINVQRAMFCNFKIFTDLSLESLAEYVYEHAICTVNGAAVPRAVSLGESVVFNEADHNKSVFIQLHAQARVIVAKTIYMHESYAQRVSGYLDFENRHDKHYAPPGDDERATINRECEIKLLEFT
ncbi:ac57-like protein [Peridroma alphabaculovirus]|uniref:Ac57-like protein n=1 Tax=Peridroma alphabaculovirus TaxID=1346829 RepID=A0A068LK82_9ABAC|nr:ac57-like protein [Peridroma alphabaculovirus]AIE47779.1 ac57-like protein [Peridroma alphabaculovirus]